MEASLVPIRYRTKQKKWASEKSDAYKEKYGLRDDGRFLPASLPRNKGIPFNAPDRSAETRFKPGLIPPNHKPAGSIRVKVDGYVEIKIEEGMHKWRLLHREVWKQHHGEYPPPGTALIEISALGKVKILRKFAEMKLGIPINDNLIKSTEPDYTSLR